MIVPFSAMDFLARAQAVYGDRTGVVDEPESRSWPGPRRRGWINSASVLVIGSPMSHRTPVDCSPPSSACVDLDE